MKPIAVLLLFATAAQAQTWTAVPAPKQPLNFVSAGSNYTWSYPFVNPSPAGTYEVSNAIVDKSHRVGVWSQPTKITVKSGWQLYGGSWNQPPTSDEAGVAWKIKCVDVVQTADFRNGSEHYLQTSYEVQSVAPYSATSPETSALYLHWQRFMTVGKLQSGGRHTTVSSSPICLTSQFPNSPVEISYCRVTETGETALSPPVQYTPPILPGMVRAETCQIQFTISEPHPQGTIGYHVYWRPVSPVAGPLFRRERWQSVQRYDVTQRAVQPLTSLPSMSQTERRTTRTLDSPQQRLGVIFAWGLTTLQPWSNSRSTKNTTSILHQPRCDEDAEGYGADTVASYRRVAETVESRHQITDWQRLPAPHCYGEPTTPNDWLWQWWDMQPRIIRTVENAPVHKAADKPQSRLCDLQVQLMQRTGNITVPSGVVYETYCPVIDEWRVEGILNTFGRTIKSNDGGRWSISRKTNQSGHTQFPAVAIYNQYSHWEGLATNGSIAAADYSGGQCFGTRFSGCTFGEGLLIHPRSAGSSLNLGGHTASELEFTNCTFAGEVPIWIGGTQSANIRFNRSHVTSNSNDRRGSSIYLESPNQIRFTNGLYTDCTNGGAIIRSNYYPVNLLIDDIWVDQGFHCFIETSHTTCNVKLRGGKLNCWAHDEHEELTLARLIDSPPSLSRLIFEDVQVQFNFQPAIDVISPHYNLCELRFTDTVLADVTWLREPTKQQEQARANVIYPWGYPAVPTRPVPGLRLSSTSSVNSLTNRPKVQREDWTATTVNP